MRPSTPSLKTLIAWANQARAGSEPLDCARWRGQAAAVERARWERVVEALEQIDQAAWPSDEPTLSAEVIAAYVDDRLTAGEAASIEQTCLVSTADLWEVISELRFAANISHAATAAAVAAAAQPPRSPTTEAQASSLVNRLLQLHPAISGDSRETIAPIPAPPIARPSSAPSPVAPPTVHPATMAAAPEPQAPPVSSPRVFTEPVARPLVVKPVRVVGNSSAGRTPRRTSWMYVAAGGAGALAALAIVVIAVLWGPHRSSSSNMGPGSLASDDDPTSKGNRPAPSVEPSAPRTPRPSPSVKNPSEIVQLTPHERPRSPSVDLSPNADIQANPSPTPATPDRTPRIAPRRSRAPIDSIAQPTDPIRQPPNRGNPSPPPNNPPIPPPPAVLALRSDLGLALVPGNSPGAWRVGVGELPLTKPLTIVSLADSWSTADVAGLGTLVLAGDARTVVSRDADQVIRVSVEHGLVGIRDLAESARVRMEAGGESWSARGIDSYSTLAVVRDDSAAGIYVSSGIIAIDDTSVSAGQASLIQAGAPSVPRSVQARVSTNSSAFMADPYDVRWLQTPDEKRKRDWQAVYGKLAEQLASSEDVTKTLRQLRESVRDGRQNALLARWNLSLADDRALTLWEMLRDRQKSVRLAATQELLSIPPRDGRLRAFFPALREATDHSTAAMVLEWVGRSHHNNTLAPANARELVDGLGHQDPAVRQVAVFLLEHYSQDALAAARLRPPAFDARDTVAKRAIAQAQWRTLASQLFVNRNRGAGAAANKAMP